MKYFCTYFDNGYLVRALALHKSLTQHLEEKFVLYAVCLDELTRLLLNRLMLPGLVTVPLHDIEAEDEALRLARQNRSLVEYYWTLTPTVLLHLLGRFPDIETLTYLDADLYFFSSPEPIFKEFDGHSILIHEHRFHETFKAAIEFGRYNVGLLCFRRDKDALNALNWWRNRCNEWCYARLEAGKYGDQMYLDDWSARFNGVRILEHIGAGVAPWNNLRYSYSLDNNGLLQTDEVPLIFYHFHALYFSHPRYVVLSKLLAHKFPLSLIRHCYLPYIISLHTALELIWAVLPNFRCSLYGNIFSPQHTAIIYKAEQICFNQLTDCAEPLNFLQLNIDYSLLLTEQVIKDD